MNRVPALAAACTAPAVALLANNAMLLPNTVPIFCSNHPCVGNESPTSPSLACVRLVDRRPGHGAIVFNAIGTTELSVRFHAFFARGSIEGSGGVTLVPGGGEQATFKGLLSVTGGTSAYRHATGELTTAETWTAPGQPTAPSRARSRRDDNPR